MAEIAEALRLLWCPGLAQLQRRPSGSMQEWLSTATYAPQVVSKSIALQGIDAATLLFNVGGDVNRVASAASETLKNIKEVQELPKSLGWLYIKLYYAALFYAHVLLRSWGRFSIFLKTSDLIILRQTLAAYGITSPFKLHTGQFLIVIDFTVSEVSLCADSGSGGSHEAVWRQFDNALGDLVVAIRNSSFLNADKSSLIDQVDAFRNLLSNNGSLSSWLSQIRNSIQYRQDFGLWYPYTGRRRAASFCLELVEALDGRASFASLATTTGDDLERFGAACRAIIVLVRATLDDLATVGGSRSFVLFGQRRFEVSLL